MFDPDRVDVELPPNSRGSASTRSPTTFAARCAAADRSVDRGRALKPLLLDQHVIAGIGNIYADEILHRRAAATRSGRANSSTCRGDLAAARCDRRRAARRDRRRWVDARRRAVRRSDGGGRLATRTTTGCTAVVANGVSTLRARAGSGGSVIGGRGRRTSARSVSAEAEICHWAITGADRVGVRASSFGAAVFLKNLTLKGFKSFADSTRWCSNPASPSSSARTGPASPTSSTPSRGCSVRRRPRPCAARRWTT